MAALGQLGDRGILVRDERDHRVPGVEDGCRRQRQLFATLGFQLTNVRRFELNPVDDEHCFVAELEVDGNAFLLENLHRVFDG